MNSLQSRLPVNQDLIRWAEATFNREYMVTPLTVECRVRLTSRAHKNVILAAGYRIGGYQLISNHWTLFTQPETGAFAVFLQNKHPAEIQTSIEITDGQWHDLAMVYETERVALYVDSHLVAAEKLTTQVQTHDLGDYTNEGPLFFGCYPPDALGCDGEIGEVRISRVARPIAEMPTSPRLVDAATIGLWRFDAVSNGQPIPDHSPTGNWVVMHDYLPTLDENDRLAFGVSHTPFSRPMQDVAWQVETVTPGERADAGAGAEEISLNGNWGCVGFAPRGQSEQVMLEDPAAWQDSFTAHVPCSIQTALLEADKIPDPMVRMNNLDITWVADREWWLRRTFTAPPHWQGQHIRLFFEGVDYRATFWLNGYRLGQHEGMFGGPAYDVSALLRYGGEENTLIVCLDPAPLNFMDTLKNNVAYGWHYVKLVTLGIWRPVRLQMRGEVALESPFLHTAALIPDGVQVELALDCRHWGTKEKTLTLEARLSPRNFTGPGYRLSVPLTVKPGNNHFGFAGQLPAARLWWPVDMGEPNLYQFECVLKDGGQVLDCYRANWGARTVEMRPSAYGPHPTLYNWQFVINGRPIWVKGANWCYPDALLRLDRRRNARFLELARNAHIQLLRVWGGGPVENDEFYDLCDELGLMVQQEFSMLGFHRLQNVPSIHATDITYYLVPRLRNRPSLVMWTGANEISGQGRIVEVLGRRCLELDGTRPFHRTCPYGGDVHWYGVYWGDQPLLDYRQVADGRLKSWSPGATPTLSHGPIAFTEWGLSSPANHETWQRILPESEWQAWPPAQDSVFIHHTPTWSQVHVEKMTRYAGEFLPPGDLPSLIQGMQIAQGLGYKFLIESMRARKPYTTATYFYKLTENYPACSWATIDQYGVPKRSHYAVQEAYQPVHVLALFDEWSTGEDGLTVSLHAINDTAQAVMGCLTATLYDGQFTVLSRQSFEITIPTERALKIADCIYPGLAGSPHPLFLCLDLTGSQGMIERNWYFFDFTGQPGSLFARPQTDLQAEVSHEGDTVGVRVENVGQVPALSVEVHPGAASNTYYAERAGLWLNPGEAVEIALRHTEAADGQTRELQGLRLSAWNAPAQDLTI